LRPHGKLITKSNERSVRRGNLAAKGRSNVRTRASHEHKITNAAGSLLRPGVFAAGKSGPDICLLLGAILLKVKTISAVDIRLTMAFSFLSLIALAAFSGTADARGCGMMKPPAYMGMRPGPTHYPMHRGMRHGGGYAPYARGKSTVISVARQAGNFTTLLAAVEKAGLTGLLEGDGPFTLFAPNEAAFADLPDGALDELLADKAKLTALVKYHLVANRVSAADVLEKRTLNTASGQELPTSDISVTRADIRAGNGIIHVVDKVLLPSG
jgi:uncharacterized surface protein with fasciclin (FAS1) repeats